MANDGWTPPHRRRIRAVHDRLARKFGALEPPRRANALDELILTILSQHTSDLNAERAFDLLQQAYPQGWPQVAATPADEIADVIRSGGLANQKAPRIRAVLHEVHDREGAYDLSRLRELDDAEARDYLTSLPGIGPKTAAVVLSFSLGRDAIPVDTHVHRVTRRLGWIPRRASAERADRILHEEIPDGLRTPLHVAFIRLGREICKAPTPRCGVCPLADLCPSARTVAGRRKG